MKFAAHGRGLLAGGLLLLLVMATAVAAAAATTERRALQLSCGQRSTSLEVEVAASAAARSIGLMHRLSLAPDSGMIFLYPREQHVTMWMKNTLISLDMLFIDAHGEVVKIARSTEPLSTALIPSGVKVKAVLEVAAGTADRLNLREGCQVKPL